MTSSYPGQHDPYREEKVDPDERGPRFAWEVTSWVILALTLLLNLVLVAIVVIKRNAATVANKALLTLGIVDLMYGVFVSPFFIENYIDASWQQSHAYCQFYEFFFTFHDLFVPLVLILLSAYISLRFSGGIHIFQYKTHLYTGLFVLSLLFSIVLAIPASVHSRIFRETRDGQEREECRTLDTYSMVLAYFLGSSLLFCFTMSFLFSLCIVGSPLLRDVYDDGEAYSQRWKLLLTMSLVNIFYIITGFLINFKEVSRFFYICCELRKPFVSTDNLTYEIVSFVFLIAEPFLRPLASLAFYLRYLIDDPMARY